MEKVLAENPTETFMCLGHGSPRGLFSADMHGFLLDRDNVHLLKDRDVIGIWCYASDFARRNNLRGFFTYMFISNAQECSYHRCGNYYNEVVYEQNRIFAEKVRGLIAENKPMEEWVDYLYESCDSSLDFVDFNYSNLAYFDGESNYAPQQLLDESWEDGTLWHNSCIDEGESYIVCYIDNDGRNVWEEYYDYDEAIDRIDELYAELNEENAEKIMLFNKNTEM